MVWTSEKKKVDFIWQEIPKDGGTEGWQKLFSFFFLLRPQALLSQGRVRILFPEANCPEGEWKIFVLRGCVSTPEGQKFFTLPKDNWPKETKFLLSRGTTRPKAEGENKLKKFLPSRSSPYFGHLEANKSNCLFFPKSIQFFLKLNLIFIDY